LIGYLKTPEEKNNKIITVIIIVTIASHVGFYVESPFFGSIYLLRPVVEEASMTEELLVFVCLQ